MMQCHVQVYCLRLNFFKKLGYEVPMKNTNSSISIPCLENDWNKQTKTVDLDLRIPQTVSIFPNKERHLCESSVDLICSIISRPCSG